MAEAVSSIQKIKLVIVVAVNLVIVGIDVKVINQSINQSINT